MKKRFLLFVFAEYYPSGGFCDCVDDFDTIDEIKKSLQVNHSDYFQVYDQDTRELVDLPDYFYVD